MSATWNLAHERIHQARARMFIATSDAHGFAVEHVRYELERGLTVEQLAQLDGGGLGAGYWYEADGERFTVRTIGDGSYATTICNAVFSLRRLAVEAMELMRERPRQTSLWNEVTA